MGPRLNHRPSHRTPHGGVSGFTVIEMLIACAVMGVIMTVALSSNSSFNKSILLSQAVHTVATSIRETQSFGIANRSLNMNAGYGLHIDYDDAGVGSYVIFADIYPSQWSGWDNCYPEQNPNLPNAKPGNCRYDSDAGELIKSYSLRGGFTISKFCGTHYYYQYVTCAEPNIGELQSLDMVFARPSTDVMMSATDYHGYQTVRFSLVTLYVRSPDGSERCVNVRDTGQVSVPQTCP